MRTRALLALTLLSLATCTNDLPVGPGGGAVLRVSPTFPSSFGLFAQALSIQSAAIKVTSLSDSTVLLNTVTAFNPASDTLRLAVSVPFQGDSASVEVALSFLDQNGAALFVDTIPIVSLVRGQAASPPTGQFPVRYVGPGSNAASVSISPRADTLAGTGVLQFTIAAMDDVSTPITQVYVHWSSSNPNARIDANGLLHGPGTAGGTIVHAAIPTSFGGTGFLEDSAMITFTGQAPPVAGTFNGSVVDGSSQVGLGGATIQAALIGVGTTYNATSASDGSFALGPLPSGTYNLTINDSTYVGTKFLNAVMPGGANVIIVLPPVPLAPTSPNLGTLNGTITDAQTDTVLTGASVSLFSYANGQGATPVATTTIDSTGTYTFSNLAAGTYTLEASAAGFVPGDRSTVVLGDVTNFSQDVVLSMGGPQFRAVLTWSANPSDLDLHAVVKNSLGVYDSVYYSQQGDTDSVGTALDHDETSGYGPETITIYHAHPGVDTFFVVNYTDQGIDPDTNLARSGATVRVYNNNALLTTLYVPNQPGTLWNLFTWNGTTLTPLNTMTYTTAVVGAPLPFRGAKRVKPAAVHRR
ncbi:MAG TPA: carboxypeptidase regulatory-like domain-containing protein [Gemmatimonadales bacterium]|nr:carboxypeptidase regulatory-like domain-containing protein [Gemmatimonadales bacterium]